MKNYFIIDSHVHLFPKKIAAKADKNISKFYDLPMECDEGSLEELQKYGKEAGVSGFLVCSPATTPKQVNSINKFSLDVHHKYENLISFGSVHPMSQNIEQDILSVRNIGLEGIKLHPDFQNFAIDCPEAMNVYQNCYKYDIPILIHMGDARYTASSPSRLRNVLNEIPNLKIIAAHLGGYQRWDESTKCLKGDFPYLRFDTSSSIRFLGKTKAKEIISYFGTDKCFFGTDFPMQSQKTAIEEFLSLGFSEKENSAIFGENIAEYLHLNMTRFKY